MTSCAQAQPAADSTAQWRTSVVLPGEALQIATDALQNVYLLRPNYDLEMYDSKGNLLYVYSNSRFGVPTHIDASDPFNILLYYADYRQLQVLDRTLNEIRAFNLIDLDYGNATAVGLSPDGALWLYDELQFRMLKIAADGRVLIESENLQLRFDQSLSPLAIFTRQNYLYVLDEALGLLAFDQFGQYLRTYDVSGAKEVSVLQRRIFYHIIGRKLYVIDLETLATYDLLLPSTEAPILQVSVQRKIVAVRYANQVTVLQLPNRKN